jgi:hypothetical protein
MKPVGLTFNSLKQNNVLGSDTLPVYLPESGFARQIIVHATDGLNVLCHVYSLYIYKNEPRCSMKPVGLTFNSLKQNNVLGSDTLPVYD